MKRILLIAPIDPSADYRNAKLSKFSNSGIKSFAPPLNLATIAALTPDDIKVDIWDETLKGLVDAHTETTNYDLVGITGYSINIARAKIISAFFRKHNIPVAIGGAGVSSAPEQCRGDFDILFMGEAELTWPQFISDWKAGDYRKEYRQIIKPDMAFAVAPKWDSIADTMHHYPSGSVQTSRGCPFECEFCDVVYLFGSKSRRKPVDTVIEEVATQERLGIKYIFFNDDNFIGSPSYAKKILRKLIPLNNSFENPLQFGTQVSMNVSRDDELLELLADANFSMLLIGIETINEESLKEVNKMQNIREDLVADCLKVQSYGMYIKGTMIVGFDNDDTDIFERQFDFMQQAHITVFNLNQLKAPLGTKLWRRLLREKRLLKDDDFDYHGNHAMLATATNIIPKKMTRVELLTGMLGLAEKLLAWENFRVRIKGYISGVKRVPRVAMRKRKISLKWIYLTVRFLFIIDKESRREILSIISYARKNAPFLMNRVIAITLSNYFSIYFGQQIEEDMMELVKLEKELDINQYIDHSQAPFSKSFEDSFKDIYLDIFKRVKAGLNDKTCTEEALVEVFTDFLTHSGKTFEHLSDSHMTILYELSDHTTAKLNRENEKRSSALSKSDGAMKKIKSRSSSSDILNIIDQNLRV